MKTLHVDATEQLRRKVLIGMCVNLGGAALLLGVANIFYFEIQALALGSMEIVYFFISVCMLVYIRKHPQPKWFLALHSFILACLVIWGSYTKAIEETLFIWAVALPTIFYVAMGKRVGLYWSLTFLILEVIALQPALSKTVLIPSTMFANFILAYLCVWVVSHAYETSRVKAVDNLKTLALHDALTGAQNRLALYSFVDKEQKNEITRYVLIIDIDDFKQFNDLHGHDVGDTVLIEVVNRIENIVTAANTYRIGGEELVVLLDGNDPDIGSTISRLHYAISDKSVLFGELELDVSFSAGLEKYRTTENFDAVLARADAGLYQAKEAGKSCTFYQGRVFARF
ncbi:GGDEF domain-containing protein [Vibrio sp. Of7-15]|uniref:GGDEF domain-containing protein n=1 Tax=Vibrio sp. Of7-15 TaxID=2724879 RepID=UPI001EF2436D|nr:GGDEF domain-containing protein [Vibrio sp. Of7-15]MCG7495987.1 GGDEF domain-containing protein [Vibrio sp. Of7-15]